MQRCVFCFQYIMACEQPFNDSLARLSQHALPEVDRALQDLKLVSSHRFACDACLNTCDAGEGGKRFGHCTPAASWICS